LVAVRDSVPIKMLRDLRLAARMLLQEKGWTSVVVLSLALGIGANTALFSAINGLLLKKLPVSDPDSLVRLRYAGPNQVRTDIQIYGYTAPDARGRQIEPSFSYPMYLQFRADNQSMSDLFACAPFGLVNVVVNGQGDIATGFVSSGNYYQVLGVNARLGRTIVPDDDRPAASPVAVISHKYWMSRFGGSASVVGTAASVNNIPVTIVGVLPPDFSGVEQTVGNAPDISLPLSFEPQFNAGLNAPPARLMQPNFWWLEVMGRLKPGVTAAQVQGNLAGVFQATARAGFDSYLASLSPEERSRPTWQDRTQVPELLVDSGSRGIYDVTTTDVRAVTVLTAVVALVLLIVCANVANLLLSRATGRLKELSVRLALGATRARLVRQLLTESLLLAAIGGALGVIIGRWGQQLLPGNAGQVSPLDWRVLTFVIAVTTVAGVVFGIAPALRATRADVAGALKETSRSVSPSRSLLGRWLVIAQVAISLILLVGAGLFLRTLHNLRQVDVGFNPRNVLLFRVNPTLNRYDSRKASALYDQIGESLRAIGGVRSVSWSNTSLMSGGGFTGGFFVQGRTYPRGQRDVISSVSVSPTFFETMEIPIVAGRGITERDRQGAPRVAVINEAAARKYFPNESPIGRYFGGTLEGSGSVEIVGVLRDAKYNGVRDAAVPTRYTPFAQGFQGTGTFEVRTAGDPLTTLGAVRDTVRKVDPTLPLTNVRTQLEELEGRFLQEKVFARAYTLFGGLALLVASIGLFGVMSYSVARRTNEIGIRMTLGARTRDVTSLVMRESLVLVAAGVAIGGGAASAASRLVASLLFGLTPNDPLAMTGAIVVMLLVSALAGYLPARRASKVDPMVALRCE
jgi:predicted permease